MNSDLRLIEGPPSPVAVREPWLVMVVDDDTQVHAVTRLALNGFEFNGRPLRIIGAHSAAEARPLLAAHPDTALLLLDVVMETDQAGLDLVQYVREELKNRAVRVVLRTGQPGQSPPREVVARYEVDDFRNKADLTVERLHVLVTAALRAYTLIRGMETYQQALARSNHELERFVYVASHDLGAPVQDMLRCVRLLKERYPTQLDGEGHELLEFIGSSALELDQLIRELLEYSQTGRAGSGGMAADLNAVVKQARRQLQSVLDERGAAVDVAPLPTVAGDPAQLERLFLNLLDNALTYQPGPRPVVSISAQPVADHWEIKVSDRGVGIDAKRLPSIFDEAPPQADGEAGRRTGQGLAMCKRIAQLHGGDVRAESQPGKGSTFVVMLPIR